MNNSPVLHQIIVALVAYACWFPCASAQDPIAGAPPATGAPPVADSKDAETKAEMPDISGTWGVETNVPGVFRTAEVTRSTGGSDFVLRAHVENTVAIQHLRWNATAKQFECELFGTGNNILAINILIPEDANTIRVQIVTPGPDRVVQKEGKWIRQFSKQVAVDKGATKPFVELKLDPAAAILSPAHQPLIQQVGASESAAAAEAQRIRDLQANGQAETNKRAIAEHQRKLTSLLSTTFDLKLQLEELQVKELQLRLSQLDRQIGQRKQLRAKIIQRRAAELMEGETLKWDSRSAYAMAVTGTPIGLAGPPHLQFMASSVKLIPVPTDSAVTRPVSPPDDERIWQTLGLRLEPAPSSRFAVGGQYRGGLTVLEVRRQGPADSSGLRQDDILLGLHHWETLSRDNVIFILNQEVAKGETLKFLALRGADIRYGHLTCDMSSTAGNQFSGFNRAARNNSTTMPNSGVGAEGIEFSPPYYQDMGRKLDAADRSVRDAEELVKTTRIFVSKQVKPASDLAAAELQLADAIRSRSLMKEEYSAAVRDLELQLESAMAEFEAASRNLERTEQLYKTAAISQKEVMDAQLKRTQTRLAMERVKVWLAVCVKAGERPTNSEPSPPQKADTTENKPSATSIQRRPKLSQPVTADSLLKILQNERDSNLILEAVRQLSTMKLDESSVSFGIDFLNAVAMHDLDYPHQPNRQPAIDYYATEVLKRMPPSARIPTAIAALKHAKSGVKLVGIWGLRDDSSLWKYADVPEFPELTQLVFAAVKNEDPQIRGAAQNFLVTTLPFTAINLTELTTEERRKTLQRFAELVPHTKVKQVIVDAISDSDINVVLGAIFNLKVIPKKLADPELSTKCAVALTQILEGMFHEAATTPSQKGQALAGLASLRANAAPAVPTLIRLLKCNEFPVNDPTERGAPANSVEEFSRRKVLMTLGRIGTSAKDALPMLEDEFKLTQRKEREDALLSGNTKSNGPTRMADSDILQAVIKSLKGEQPFMFRGRDFGSE